MRTCTTSGSVTVDQDLMDAADLLEGEQVAHRRHRQRRPPRDLRHRGRAGLRRDRDQRRRSASGQPRRPGHPHRLRMMDEQELREYQPRVVFVDGDNRQRRTRRRPGARPRGLRAGVAAQLSVLCRRWWSRAAGDRRPQHQHRARAVLRRAVEHVEAGAGLADAHRPADDRRRVGAGSCGGCSASTRTRSPVWPRCRPCPRCCASCG